MNGCTLSDCYYHTSPLRTPSQSLSTLKDELWVQKNVAEGKRGTWLSSEGVSDRRVVATCCRPGGNSSMYDMAISPAK
jgi:hypothetical protein